MLSQPPPRRASLQSPSSGPCRLRLGRNALPAVEAERWQRKTETLWGCKSGSIYIYTHIHTLCYIMIIYTYIMCICIYIYMHTLCVYIYAYIMCIYIYIMYILSIHTYTHTLCFTHIKYIYIHTHITYIMYIYTHYPIFIHKSDFFHSSKLGDFPAMFD